MKHRIGQLNLSLLARPESHPGHEWSPLWTPPRRRRLNFRIGQHKDFVEAVLDRLARRQHIAALGDSPLANRTLDVHFTGEPASNWLTGLISAWAEVADILTFYQERWIQEGFLRTAVEDQSVTELARMIGYQPRPATSGEAWLAFLVAPGEELPHEIDLAERLRVQAVPVDGRPPQSFELATGTAIERRFNHLAMPPAGSLGSEAALEWVDLAGDALSMKVRGASVAPGEGLALGGFLLRDDVETPFSRFVIVSDSKSVPGHPGLIELSWQQPLIGHDAEQLTVRIRTADVLRHSMRLFGAAAPLWDDTPLEVQRRQQPLEGGVAIRSADGQIQPSNGALDTDGFLPVMPLQTLHWVAGTVLAGGPDGVFRSRDRGVSWQKSTEGLSQTNTLCLVPDGDTAILAGTNGGIFRSTDGGRVWDRASGRIGSTGGPLAVITGSTATSMDTRTIRSLYALRRDSRRDYFAGTDEGIFRSADMGSSWRPSCRGLPAFDAKSETADVSVHALDGDERTGLIVAGTSAGVYESRDRGKTWTPRNLGLPNTHPISEASKTAVFGILVVIQRRLGIERLFAGTELGLFVLDAADDSWALRPFEADAREPIVVRSLAMGRGRQHESMLFAGTDSGLWSSRDYGETWSREPMAGATRQPVTALAADGNDLAVATPFDGFARDEWPGFELRTGQIDLESQATGIVAGGRVVLDRSEPGTDDARVMEIEGVQNLDRRDFALSGRISRLFVDRSIDLSVFDLRTTLVWLRSEPLPLARDPMLGWSERLQRFTSGLRAWGDRKVLGVVESQFWQLMLFARRLETAATAETDEALRDALGELILEIGRLRRLRPISEPLKAIDLANRLESTQANIKLLHDRLLRSLPDLEDASPTAFVEAAEGGSPFPRLVLDLLATAEGTRPEAISRKTLESALNAFIGRDGETTDTETIRFEAFGNLGPMSEGTTYGEILGSGDADSLFQRYTLDKPLVWDETEDGLRASLQVEVDSQPWHRVASLHGQGPEDRVYEVRRDVFGRDQVLFGDGAHGALLPNGRENVRAYYRTDVSSRAVARQSLTMIQSRPLGLARTFNPYTGTAGEVAEATGSIRREAPLGTRSFERVVSRSDYEDFTRSRPGVTRARAFVVETATATVLQITVALDNTLDRYRDPEELASTLRAISGAIARRRDTDSPFEVQEVTSIPVGMDVIVRYDPELVPNAEAQRQLDALLRQALNAKFAFAQRDFAVPLSASEVIRVLQDQRQVRMVRLCDFGRTDGQNPPAPAGQDVVDRSVEAQPGRDGEGLQPAQVAWLDLGACRLRIVSMDAVDVDCGDATESPSHADAEAGDEGHDGDGGPANGSGGAS